jgi:4-hydroxybenzoate polyprenyltransferase
MASSDDTQVAPGREHLSDIRPSDWVDRWLPPAARPYARLARVDRPIGTWLTLLPGWWALALTGAGVGQWPLYLLFGLGALAMRSAGSTVNDIWDRDIDGRVARTRLRPLASEQVSVRAALAFLVAQLAVAAAILLVLPLPAIVAGIAIVPLVLIYPRLKRHTHWPQLGLGMCFNWGIVIGWATTTGTVSTAALLLWAGAVCWQIGYDTIYAYVDWVDDLKLGVKSTAIRFGRQGRTWIAGFYVATVALWLAAGLMLEAGIGYYAGLAATAAHFAWQIVTFHVDRPEHSLVLFRKNFWPAVFMFVGCVLAGKL